MEKEIRVCKCGRTAVKFIDYKFKNDKFCSNCGEKYTYDDRKVLSILVDTETSSSGDLDYPQIISIEELKEILGIDNKNPSAIPKKRREVS